MRGYATTQDGAPPTALIGIVLAGGRSRRYGSDKLVVRLGVLTLLERAVRTVGELAPDVIVAGRGAPELPVSRDLPGIRLHGVVDPVADGGPLVGLAAGLRYAATLRHAPSSRPETSEPSPGLGRRIVLLVGGDMPWLRPGVLAALAGRIADGASAAVCVQDGTWRPLPVGLALGPALEAAEAHLATGHRDLFGMLRRLGPSVVEEAIWRPVDPGGVTFLDVDRPDDVARGRSPQLRLESGGDDEQRDRRP